MFKIIIAVLSFIKSKISSSSFVSFLELSNIAIIKSLSLATFLDFSIPISSTLLSAFLIPAVSTNLKGIPSIVTNSSIVSLVVPAISVTIAFSSPARRFNKEDCLDLETLNNDDFNSILHSGYELEGFIKMFFKKEEAFSTMFFMNQAITKEELIHATQSIFNDSECGKVFRIKGFIPENDLWIELNATKDQITTETIAKGQEIIIVIGESLNKEKIEEYIKKPA